MKRRTLLLMRHAKSSWKDASLEDLQRPLSRRGRHDVPRMGHRLATRGACPDLILSSPARRALQTTRALARPLHYPRARIRVEPQLYGARPEQLLRLIERLEKRHRRVLLCGHNPELLALVQRFAPEITALPTCAVAELRFKARSWRRIDDARLVKAKLRRPHHK
jgi:phosphohistidine phosphatase